MTQRAVIEMAYQQGQDAYAASEGPDDNPYTAGTAEHRDWRDGWSHAWCDDDDADED